jgi:hypothetical protein
MPRKAKKPIPKLTAERRTTPAPDAVVDRLVFQVDENSEPGNCVEALAALLLELANEQSD